MGNLKKNKSRFVDIIVRCRKENGWSQETFSKMLGIERNAYGHIETGRTALTSDVMERALNKLGISIRLIVGEKIID